MNFLIRFIILSFLASVFLFAESRFEKQSADANKRINISDNLESTKQYDNKLDPLLRSMVRSYEVAVRTNKAVDVEMARFADVAAIQLDYTNLATVQLFIESSATAATSADVTSLGGNVGTIIEDILIVELPLDKVYALASKNAVSQIALSSINQPMLNESHVEIGANLVHTGNAGLPVAYTGDGVVVGVLDSGLHFAHSDFWANGSIRIKYLWDMSGTGNPPAGYNYGSEWTGAEMQNGSATQIDGNGGGGHGTHVTGTAAGNGSAVNGYVGTAPESDIVFVKGIRDHNSAGGFSDTDVVNGCAYIFSKASEMNEAAVINLSLGGQYGPHDGTSLYEQALDALTGSGRIIVAAGGNEGSSIIHASYATQAGTSYNDALETVWTVNQGSQVSLVDMWYDSGSISVGLAAYDTYGTLLGFTNPVAPGQNAQNINFDPGTGTLGIVSIDASVTSDPQNGASRVQVLIDSQNGTLPIDQVFWSLYTFGSGTFDAWMVIGGAFTQDSGTFFRPGDSNLTIGVPGTANDIITVGSYVTKNQWVDLNGITQTQPGNPTIGNISSFSSIGPSRDGRLKPDITAPGEAILSAASFDLTIGVGVQAENIHVSGELIKQQGTSMAAPHVAGVIGLMLERNPGLNVADVRSILANSARPVGTPNVVWGNGKIDAAGAVASVITGIGDEPTAGITSFELDQNHPNPFNPSTTISYRLPESSDVTLKIYNTLGQTVSVLVNEQQPAGSYTTQFQADQLPSGVYYYQLEAGSNSTVRKMMLLK